MTVIAVDANIPYAEQVLKGLGEVRRFDGRNIQAQALVDCDALIVRSVTPVNAGLLEDSQVSFVGSTTIGTDHMDLGWLTASGITHCNAPGCNAEAVADYVVAALCRTPDSLQRLLQGERAGIIGLGNVGSAVAGRLQALGIDWIAYDPLLKDAQLPLASLHQVLACAVVCLHTPLTIAPPFPTRHMIDSACLRRLSANALLLNAGRGPVIPEQDLLAFSRERADVRLVLDVWEHEPTLIPALVERCHIATPHIAGYSLEGKWRGLIQVATALAAHLQQDLNPEMALPTCDSVAVPSALSELEAACAAVETVVGLGLDDQALRAVCAGNGNVAGEFDRLRRQYRQRRELKSSPLTVPEALSGQWRSLFSSEG